MVEIPGGKFTKRTSAFPRQAQECLTYGATGLLVGRAHPTSTRPAG